jgi:hypothetical protein
MQLVKYGYLIISLLTVLLNETQAQNYIGMTKDDIIVEMNTSHKSFKLNTSNVNPYYKYLKYEDNINEITILFFLSENDKCTLVRKMCDYMNINEEIDDLNKKYKPIGKDKWSYTIKGKIYLVTLLEEEWYFTITTKQKK